jgi:hypothetical protein
VLVNVRSTTNRRAEIQNGWWDPKILVWFILLVTLFLIPDAFFMFWGNWVALAGAAVFILIGPVLLVDFAHSFTEMCLDKWENSMDGSNISRLDRALHYMYCHDRTCDVYLFLLEAVVP